jgi:hypothetical protein
MLLTCACAVCGDATIAPPTATSATTDERARLPTAGHLTVDFKIRTLVLFPDS